MATPLLPATAAARSVTVQVTGLRGALRKNVLATLSIANRRERKGATDAYLRHLHSRAEQEIRRALEPYGYFRPLIHSELVTDGRWAARYEIQPGPPMRLDSVRVAVGGEGGADPGYQKLIVSFPLHKGDVLDQQKYELAKAGFESYAADAGYLDARFTASAIHVDVQSYTSSIDLEVDSGAKHYFGNVRFDQHVIDSGVVAKFVTFHPGDPFRFRKLLEMQTGLSNTGFFERVEVQPDTTTGHEEGHRLVPILVTLTPARRVRLTSGLGYGTDDGARATSLIEMRRLNREGHHAEVDLQAGQLVNHAGAAYLIPWPSPRTDVARFSGGYEDVRTNVSHGQAAVGGVSLTRMLADWQTSIALNYRNETFTVGPDHGTARFLLPEASWTRIRSQDRFGLTGGDRVRVSLRGAARALLSDANFLQPRAEGKLVYDVGPQFRALARLEAGTTQIGNFHRLPPSLRFFAGGMNSVRGYSYNSLGPQDSTGHVIGGRNLITGSIEANYFFPIKMGPAVFFDMGNAFNTRREAFKKGVGVGLRWISPMGLVRGDVAWGLDRKGRAVEFHLAVGPEL